MARFDDDKMTPSQGTAPTIDPAPVTSTTHPTKSESADTETVVPGERVGDYVIEEKIGWGGCSTVYRATHRTSKAAVAVKIMHPGLAESPRQVQRFVQEAQALRLIEHPTIVEVYDIGRMTDGRPYIVMELLRGTNLASLIHGRGRFSPPEVLELLRPIGEALTLAHGRGIIHRDIKASNIIIVEGEGDDHQVKLLDFGIAKLVHAGSTGMQTTVGHVLGTPHSMAPEQIRGERIDGRTDIYALGALLFRLLTGKHPFEGCDPLTLTRMHVHSPPPPPSQSAPVPPVLDAVVRRAMEKEAANRYDTVATFIEALAEAIGSAPAAAEDGARAVAIYVEGRVESGSETDDDLLDDLMNILDIAEQTFEQHDFLVPLQTGNAILGALLLGTGGEEEAVRLQVMDVATELDQALATRRDADDRIEVNLCLHIDDAKVRAHGDHHEIVGGPIVDVGAWAPRESMDGVWATPETLGFAIEARDRGSRSYVRIGSRRGSGQPEF